MVKRTDEQKEHQKKQLKLTKEKRKHQNIFTLSLKVSDYNPDEVFQRLNKLGLESKWLFNYLVSLPKGEIFDEDKLTIIRKLKSVLVKLKDGTLEERKFDFLSAKSIEGIISRFQSDIKSLSTRKKNGGKVGKIKYIGHIPSIPFRQYNYFKFSDANHINISKIGEIKVDGIEQLIHILPNSKGIIDKKDVSWQLLQKSVDNNNVPNMLLIKDNNGSCYIHITVFYDKNDLNINKLDIIGVDFNVSHPFTYYDGKNAVRVDCSIPQTEREKGLQRKLSRQKRLNCKCKFKGESKKCKCKMSKNYIKTKLKLNKEIQNRIRKRKEIQNKIIHILSTNVSNVASQDEGNIKNWQKTFGKKPDTLNIGEIISSLKQKKCFLSNGKWKPTTKTCPKCGYIQNVRLNEKEITCKGCNDTLNRDTRGAMNNYREGLLLNGLFKSITPAGEETSASLRQNLIKQLCSINDVKVSIFDESGKRVQMFIKDNPNKQSAHLSSIKTLSDNSGYNDKR